MEDAPAEMRPNNIAEPVIDYFDFAENFATDKTFSTRDDLLKWVRGEAVKLGFTIIISKSDNGSDKRKQTLVLGCERGGVYRENKKKLKGQDTRSIKCECPFRLRGYFLSSGVWKITVVCGKHNHETTKDLEGHLIPRRLNMEDRKLVEEMTSNMVQPKNILMTLKKRSYDNVANIKHIYNARHRYKKGEMQHMMDLLVEGGNVPNEGHPDISITEELEAIQVRFNNADYITKMQIKEQLRQIAFPETTPPCPPGFNGKQNM
ncbi:protein FAR1-RELATED SEQUENCE [Trifolium repens]|nr:protein FAR1-RELATED SEQUENCE [Trifolium repens]